MPKALQWLPVDYGIKSRRFVGTSNTILCTCCPSSASHLLCPLLPSTSPASVHLHQTGPVSLNLRSDASRPCGQRRRGLFPSSRALPLDGAGLQGGRLTRAEAAHSWRLCRGQDRLGRAHGTVAEVWARGRQTRALVWAVPLAHELCGWGPNTWPLWASVVCKIRLYESPG